MRAAVVTAFDGPVTVQERATPTAGPGQVLVGLEVCGLCHTDIHAARGDWPITPTLPFVPGHEGIGRIERVGTGVGTARIGQRVALAWLGSACGSCRFCLTGRENLCPGQRNTGYSVDGCFAEYAVAEAGFAVPVPDAVSSVDAAPLACAGVTTYAAIKAAAVRPAERVAVFGVGGLGHLAVQYARLAGAEVVAIDIARSKLRLATELGADHVVNAAAVDPVEALHALGGVDVAVVLSVAPFVGRQALASLNRAGRLVLVSLPAHGELTVPIFDTVLKGITVIGSIVGTRQDLSEVLRLHALGRTTVITQTRPLQDIERAFEDVLAGSVAARVVFDLQSVSADDSRNRASLLI